MPTFRETGILNVASALRSPREEALGALTHGVGWVLSVVASVALMSRVGDSAPLMSRVCGFYCVALMGVFAASTLSHLYLPERYNLLFRSLDQGFIYLLVVGTMAPFVIAAEPGPVWLWCLYGLMGVALFGFASKTLLAHQLHDVTLWLYLILGWGQVLIFGPLLIRLPMSILGWIVAGGVTYTIGYVFLVLDNRRLHFHAIWHVFVVLGGGCHYLAIWRAVAQ